MVTVGKRAILHVDMDAFYAAVEERENPALRGRPVVVGSEPKEGRGRGVVATANYAARRYGIGSAMPISEAWQRCPKAVYLRPRMRLYADVSQRVRSICERFTDLIEPISIDEAFLDVTASRRLYGDGPAIALQVKDTIRGEEELTASIGCAASKFVAKIASDLEKPDGLTVVPQGGAAEFLAPLLLERMWRVGPKARVKLHAAGLQTIGDLARADVRTLEQLLGSWGPVARELARGLDERPVVVGAPPKSLGSESTFEHDLTTSDALLKPILRQSMQVADRLVNKGLWAQVVTLKIKYGDHRIRTRQVRLSRAVSDTDAIFQAARALLTRCDALDLGVRLTGVSVSSLTKHPDPELFPDAERARRERLAATTRALRERFGTAGVTRASLIPDVVDAGDSRR